MQYYTFVNCIKYVVTVVVGPLCRVTSGKSVSNGHFCSDWSTTSNSGALIWERFRSQRSRYSAVLLDTQLESTLCPSPVVEHGIK